MTGRIDVRANVHDRIHVRDIQGTLRHRPPLSGDWSRQHPCRRSVRRHDRQRSEEELDALPDQTGQIRQLFRDQNAIAQQSAVNRPVEIWRPPLARQVGRLGVDGDELRALARRFAFAR
jgi:hypothetical protein